MRRFVVSKDHESVESGEGKGTIVSSQSPLGALEVYCLSGLATGTRFQLRKFGYGAPVMHASVVGR